MEKRIEETITESEMSVLRECVRTAGEALNETHFGTEEIGMKCGFSIFAAVRIVNSLEEKGLVSFGYDGFFLVGSYEHFIALLNYTDSARVIRNGVPFTPWKRLTLRSGGHNIAEGNAEDMEDAVRTLKVLRNNDAAWEVSLRHCWDICEEVLEASGLDRKCAPSDHNGIDPFMRLSVYEGNKKVISVWT